MEPICDRARLERFDLIVPIWTMGDLSGEQEEGLEEAVRAGAGLAEVLPGRPISGSDPISEWLAPHLSAGAS